MIEREITLPLGEESSPVRVSVSQFDTMWRFMFTVVYRGHPWEIPLGAGVILNGRKPDGNVFAFDGTVTEGKVAVDCNVQMTAVAGPVLCELSVLSGDKTVGTANFILDVEAAPKSPEDVSSESTLPAYQRLLEAAASLTAGGAYGGPALDDTLTVSGAAADAAAVGQRFAGINAVTPEQLTAALAGKANVADLAGKADVSALATKADVSALATKADVSALAGKADISELEGKADVSALASKADVSALNAKADKITEVTVSAAGAVSQALEAGKWYHFTGALTGLTITLTAPASGELAQYHFDFTSGATAPTLTMPDSVVMPEGFSVEANKRYEVDILNNYGAVMSWTIA